MITTFVRVYISLYDNSTGIFFAEIHSWHLPPMYVIITPIAQRSQSSNVIQGEITHSSIKNTIWSDENKIIIIVLVCLRRLLVTTRIHYGWFWICWNTFNLLFVNTTDLHLYSAVCYGNVCAGVTLLYNAQAFVYRQLLILLFGTLVRSHFQRFSRYLMNKPVKINLVGTSLSHSSEDV